MAIFKGIVIALSVLCMALDFAVARDKGIAVSKSVWALNIGCIIIALLV